MGLSATYTFTNNISLTREWSHLTQEKITKIKLMYLWKCNITQKGEREILMQLRIKVFSREWLKLFRIREIQSIKM